MEGYRFKLAFEGMSSECVDTIDTLESLASGMSIFMREYQGREMDLALIQLEQALMWAIKAICIKSEELKNRRD